MNERLEKEIDSYIATHFSEAYDGVLLSDATSTELAITDVAPMARYFYSLALQNVKNELERFIREKCCRGYSGINVCRDMIKFIDKLTE